MGAVETMHDLLVGQDPLAPALALAGRSTDKFASLNYAAFREVCSSVAHTFDRYGLCRGQIVALLAPHTLETAALLIAIPKCARVCVPINPNLEAAASIDFILRDTGASVLIVCYVLLFSTAMITFYACGKWFASNKLNQRHVLLDVGTTGGTRG